MVSAVTPVWSETKKTVRRLTVEACPVASEMRVFHPAVGGASAVAPGRKLA